ncbi:hypothetical protein B0F90DRAFT_1793271 [Multifurca ochricompacta]|uniref:Uncharacterized protein n=1 Tax=Multifurca ochricompacta TaxID=376703 RepID=A0AAD4LTM9_9AGAM|nr:hypothetical protein B0F90DRAFT_1793271 [Multifurca ochricompacta]
MPFLLNTRSTFTPPSQSPLTPAPAMTLPWTWVTLHGLKSSTIVVTLATYWSSSRTCGPSPSL